MALLIGNSEYVLGSLLLRTPVNDASALGQALSRLGFEVEVLEDAGRTAMQRELAIFAERARGAEIALFFFAGHAVRLAATSYLLATSIPEVSREGAIHHALGTREILKALLSAAPDIGIIILNTGQDNPFTRERDGIPPIAKPGLTLPKKEDVEGLFVAYATDAGDTGLDSQRPRSAFTAALLENIETPGLTVKGMFRLIRQKLPHGDVAIREDTFGSHYTNAEPDTVIILVEEKELAEKAMSTGDLALLEEYERRYPQGVYRNILNIHRKGLVGPPRPEARPDGTGVNIEEVPRAQLPRVRAALTVLGLYGDTDKGISGISDQPLQIAAERYLSRYGRERLDVETLIADARRRSLLVGAALGKDISRDLRWLRAVEVVYQNAQRKLKVAEETAANHPRRDRVLAKARRGVASIQSMLEGYKLRLDQTWDLYDRLLDRSQMLDLPEPDEPGTMVPSDEYGQLFRKHVQAQHELNKPGTYSWLDDFRPRP